ncbi:hypothetical protein ROP_01400 [Rhodococcus opacus B4]|uniref:Uncharacterized protein n=1 Tax=Rhodococcus opacus (strain B4) TaxID=632772 RepID=C1ASD8_RHOOB|nr:hypothetical protein ROP_01400 [Rhodococcus opacus B4]
MSQGVSFSLSTRFVQNDSVMESELYERCLSLELLPILLLCAGGGGVGFSFVSTVGGASSVPERSPSPC